MASVNVAGNVPRSSVFVMTWMASATTANGSAFKFMVRTGDITNKITLSTDGKSIQFTTDGFYQIYIYTPFLNASQSYNVYKSTLQSNDTYSTPELLDSATSSSNFAGNQIFSGSAYLRASDRLSLVNKSGTAVITNDSDPVYVEIVRYS